MTSHAPVLSSYVDKLYNYYWSTSQDGGCTCPGDVAKAFGAGADFVMLGGMLAGHTESGGETIEKNGKKYKVFYGMSSATAMKKHSGGVAEYRLCSLCVPIIYYIHLYFSMFVLLLYFPLPKCYLMS